VALSAAVIHPNSGRGRALRMLVRGLHSPPMTNRVVAAAVAAAAGLNSKLVQTTLTAAFTFLLRLRLVALMRRLLFVGARR
jgi:hypothetical protein